ncbi:MAG: hypothetical protein RR340_04445 [Cloacibacillus sp.]
MRYSVIFVILIAASSIMIEDSTLRYPVWFSIFFNSLMTAAIFNLLCAGRIRRTYAACAKHKALSLRMMFFTLLIYTLCFFSTERIGASNYNSFYFAGSAILGRWFMKARGAARKANAGAAAALLVLCAAYGFYICAGADCAAARMSGIFWAVIGSASGYLYAVDSSKLAKLAALSANQLLALRFNLLLVVSFFLLPADTASYISPKSMEYMLALAATGTALPVYFLQRGISAAGAETNAVITAFIPFLTTVLSIIFYGTFNAGEAIFVLALTALLAAPMLAEHFYKKEITKS